MCNYGFLRKGWSKIHVNSREPLLYPTNGLWLWIHDFFYLEFTFYQHVWFSSIILYLLSWLFLSLLNHFFSLCFDLTFPLPWLFSSKPLMGRIYSFPSLSIILVMIHSCTPVQTEAEAFGRCSRGPFHVLSHGLATPSLDAGHPLQGPRLPTQRQQ